MKILLVVLTIMVLPIVNIYSQEILYNGDGTVNESVIENYEVDQLNKLYDKDSKEYDVLKSAKTYHVFGEIFSSVGGALVGWPIGTHIGGGEANWTLAYAGLGAIAVGFVFEAISQSYINESIDLYIINYNEGLALINTQFQGSFTYTAVGIRINL